jgi:murein L,D-transpeptidase YcbB/YkuD
MAATPQVDSLLGPREGIDLIAADVGPSVGMTALSYSVGNSPAASSQSNPHAAELRIALDSYRATWGRLPRTQIPAGAAMRIGHHGMRVAALRERLGLDAGDHFDEAVAEAVRAYRRTHGLGDSAIADAQTLNSLNRGAEYYEQLIRLNIERAQALPARSGRYILVDAAAARLWMYEDDRLVDSMKVIVGKKESPTPMLATSIRWAELNPYWNVPHNLVQKTIAPGVMREGLGYLRRQQYDVMSDWTHDAKVLDPGEVDWRQIAEGKAQVRVRQRPGAANAMGEIKFVMRNDLGIYLHDTPNKELFAREDRWQSNGCVRVEDARRLARWLAPELTASGQDGEFVAIAHPVPVYITYLTVAVDRTGGAAFRADPYLRDAPALARLFSKESRIQTALKH